MTTKPRKAMRCLAVITARAGSKGVKDKNLRDLAGRPTIAYTIDTALRCTYIDTVCMTTDSPAIRDIALSMGVEAPFLRPEHLATDTARQEDAILHAMQWYESRNRVYDLMCLLEPTVPLRTVASLNRGFEKLADNAQAEAVFSITKTDMNPIYCNTRRSDGTLKDFIPKAHIWANRQELPEYFKLSSLVTICRWETFKQKQTFLLDTTLALEVDAVEAIDIDEPIDFFLVEHLMRANVANTISLRVAINGA